MSVLNLLATADDELTASQIARQLHLSTSTCATVLASLDDAGFVERSPDKAYQLGAGLLPLVDALRGRFPLLGAAHEELRRLHDALRCGCTFTQIATDQMRLLAGSHDPGQLPEGIRIGGQYPVDPPYGWMWVAWRPPNEIEEWIDRAPWRLDDVERAHYRRVLAGIRERGYSVASLEPAAATMLDDLRAVLAALAEDPTSDALRTQLTGLFGTFGRHPYSSAELSRHRSLPVSYILAPVFGPDGQPGYEIELALVRPRMSRDEIARCGAELLASTRNLTRLIGGERPPNTRKGA